MAFPSCNTAGTWPLCCEKVELWRATPIVKQVIWQKPSTGKIKVNTDGSFVQGTRRVGIGGSVRNDQGNLIMAFSLPLQSNNNNITKAMAAKVGIQ